MQIVQHATYLLCPAARTRLWHASRSVNSHHIPFFVQHIAQCPAIDKIHHQVVLPAFDKEVAHAGNAGVVEVKQHCCLASKPLDGLGAVGIVMKLVQHLLHRTGTIEARIYGTINGAHAT